MRSSVATTLLLAAMFTGVMLSGFMVLDLSKRLKECAKKRNEQTVLHFMEEEKARVCDRALKDATAALRLAADGVREIRKEVEKTRCDRRAL